MRKQREGYANWQGWERHADVEGSEENVALGCFLDGWLVDE